MTNSNLSLTYFSESEFQGQFDMIEPMTLLFIDKVRELWGSPISVSQATGAVGRTYGNGYHNHTKHGKIYAVDLLPSNLNTQADARRFFDVATKAAEALGIEQWGIGIYPKWNSGVGIHLDTGQRGKEGPATWSALPLGPNGSQKYYGWETGVRELDE